MKSNHKEKIKKGNEFHRDIQRSWKKDKKAEGKVDVEHSCIKPSGRKGRIDIHVEADDKLVACVELKNTDWELISEARILPNVKRHASQVWDYIESQLREGKDVSPGIIFPKKPKDENRLKLIERLFEDEGIPVVWEDESIEDRKRR